MKTSGIITLTTDFGMADPYVGAMKGAILSINPDATLVDITHDIEPGAVNEAAVIIRETHAHFPAGTVHLGVVDPGVGGDRHPVVFQTKTFLFIGPDNGLFWPTIKKYGEAETIVLTEEDYFRKNISRTFHGRDIFAPVAAHLSMGVDPMRMGSFLGDPVKLEIPGPVKNGDRLAGIVLRVDRFGNLITNINEDNLMGFLGKSDPVVKIGNRVIRGLKRTYSEVPKGGLLALIGSGGFLEISQNMGRACDSIAAKKAVRAGKKVVVTRNKL